MKHNLTSDQVNLIRAHVANNNDIETSEVSDAMVFSYIEDSTLEEVADLLDYLS